MTSGQSREFDRQLVARIERWPITGAFTISRGAKTEAVTVVAEVSRDGHTGRGEGVPFPRYGESPGATFAGPQALPDPIQAGPRRKARPLGQAPRAGPH